MLRIILINLLLFLLPFLLYILYAWMRGSLSSEGVLDEAPIAWLLIAGTVIVLGSIGYFISFEGGRPEGTYHAPVVKNGKIIPGYVE